MNLINLENIDVSYDGKNKILENLNLKIKKGELVSLLGPSGCGKTTTLRVVAGFIEPTGGKFTLYEKLRELISKRGMVIENSRLAQF